MNPTDPPSRTASRRPWLARFTRVAAMVVFTAMIAVISYLDGLYLIRHVGDEDWSAYLYPLIPDGLILICSVRLHEAAPERPGWAMAGVIIGIALTLAMNVGAGVLHNLLYAIADGVVPIVFFVALEVVRGSVKGGDGGGADAADVPSAVPAEPARNGLEPAEPPSREHLILALAATGTREEVGAYLGIHKSKVQRLVTEARKALQAGPEEMLPETEEADVPEPPAIRYAPALNGASAGG